MAKVDEFDKDGNLVVDQPDTQIEVHETSTDNEDTGGEVSTETQEPVDPAAPKETDTETIRQMREHFKEQRQEKIRLQNEVNALKAKIPQQQGELREPTMEDVGFDAKKYRDAMFEYARKVTEQENQKNVQKQEQEELNAAWNASVHTFNARKSQIEHFDEAELAIDSTLTPIQKGIIISASNDAAKTMFEIGNDDNLLSELSKIKDLTKFAARIGELNARVKKVTIPKPESRVDAPSAAASMAGGPDKKLAALREEADRTGDFTKVNAYKKMLKNGGR